MVRASTFLGIGCLLVGCTADPAPGDAGASEGWVALPNDHATSFRILTRGAERRLLVFGHGGTSDTIGRYRIGGSEEGADAGWLLLSATPQRLVLGSTTHVPYVSALHDLGAVVGVAHGGQVRDMAFRTRWSAGEVQDVANGDGIDRERLLALAPDLFTVYPFGAGHTLHGTGVPEVAVSEYLEDHPLGRAEWVRFFGVLLGHEREADSLYAGIKARYEALRADSASGPHPRVLFGSVWNGQWWVPPGNSHMARLIADAGGRYVFAHRLGLDNIAVDMETLVAMGDSIDRWGMIADVDGTPVVSDFTGNDHRLDGLKAVRRHGLFIGNTRTADLFGQALLEPDVVLKDLRACLRGERPPERFSARIPYFRPLPPAPEQLPPAEQGFP